MEELKRQLDAQANRLDTEFELLELQIDRLIDDPKPSYESVCIAVSQVKRVGRSASLLKRTLAQLRDSYSQEAQGKK